MDRDIFVSIWYVTNGDSLARYCVVSAVQIPVLLLSGIRQY